MAKLVTCVSSVLPSNWLNSSAYVDEAERNTVPLGQATPTPDLLVHYSLSVSSETEVIVAFCTQTATS